ncbi:hypothetical protein K523DRAFT_374117 [Schizophyllum commune Tattone D]|nr:hypothetical protein K523DRAFT_374117 [Schizophyllum commune Tattone D]
MSTPISISGLYKDTLNFADEMARNARLDRRLPEGTDFTAGEMKALQEQLHALTIFPTDKRDWFYLAFSARHLPALVDAIRTTSRETQRKAFSSYIQLLSLLPDPERNPYLRKFLLSERAAGLPNIVAQAFNDGIEWLRPSGPGPLAALLRNLLQWCDTEMGDDKRASIDKARRDRLARKLGMIMANERFKNFEMPHKVEVEMLHKLLNAIDAMEPPAGEAHADEEGTPTQPGYLLRSTREYLEGKIPGQYECNVCMEEDAELRCAKCKAVKYCSKECQMQDWKGGHRMQCYETVF